MTGEGAPVDLNGIMNGGGISNLTGGLNLPGGAGGPIQPGKGGTDLGSLRGGQTGGAAGTGGAGTETKVVPKGDVTPGPASASVPIANMESVIRSQIFPAAKRCYQRGLEQDPTQSGKIVISIKVDPSGEVSSASVAANNGLSGSVASCIVSAAKRAQFGTNPGGAGPGAVQLRAPVAHVAHETPRSPWLGMNPRERQLPNDVPSRRSRRLGMNAAGGTGTPGCALPIWSVAVSAG